MSSDEASDFEKDVLGSSSEPIDDVEDMNDEDDLLDVDMQAGRENVELDTAPKQPQRPSNPSKLKKEVLRQYLSDCGLEAPYKATKSDLLAMMKDLEATTKHQLQGNPLLVAFYESQMLQEGEGLWDTFTTLNIAAGSLAPQDQVSHSRGTQNLKPVEPETDDQVSVPAKSGKRSLDQVHQEQVTEPPSKTSSKAVKSFPSFSSAMDVISNWSEILLTAKQLKASGDYAPERSKFCKFSVHMFHSAYIHPLITC